MSLSMIPKASTEAISLGGGFIIGDLLLSIGINENKILYGVLNSIPIPLSLRSMVKKSCEAIFMRVAGFVCNYPCIMSCDKEKRARLGWTVK